MVKTGEGGKLSLQTAKRLKKLNTVSRENSLLIRMLRRQAKHANPRPLS